MTRRHNSARVEQSPVALVAYALAGVLKHAENALQRIRIRWLWPVACGGKPRSLRYEAER